MTHGGHQTRDVEQVQARPESWRLGAGHKMFEKNSKKLLVMDLLGFVLLFMLEMDTADFEY